MLDHFHIPTATGNAEVFYFEGGTSANASEAIGWAKPRGKSMIHILLVGAGGSGSSGAVGANSAAAGGGGGGSGAQTTLLVPLSVLPDTLYLSLPYASDGTLATVSIDQQAVTINRIASAAPGDNAVAASGATAGTAGLGGSVATVTTMRLGWNFRQQVLGGQAGTAGGTTGSGSTLTLPTTGLLVSGGSGGAGVATAAATGQIGGTITSAIGSYLPWVTMDSSGATNTTPGSHGSSGCRPIPGLMYGYGGAGGGSSHGSATTTGLVGGNGGNGAPGCGGGGGGGCLTGGTAGVGGRGGPAFCVITCW